MRASPKDIHQQIVCGNESAFRTFMEWHASHLYHYALGIVNVKELAEEVVSDVFMEVWKTREGLDRILNIKSWLLVITYRKSISCLRKETGKDYLSFEETENFFFTAIQTPDEAMISKEEMERINDAIEKLPPKCKHVFYLAKMEELPYKEIASMLDISVKTINNHIAYALEMISKNLNISKKNQI